MLRLLQNVRNKEIAAEEDTTIGSVHSYNNNLRGYLRIGKDEQVSGLFDLVYSEPDEVGIAQEEPDQTEEPQQNETEAVSSESQVSNAADIEQETAEAAATSESSAPAEAPQQLPEGKVVSLRREPETASAPAPAPTPHERLLNEEPLHVQTAHRFTQLIAAERSHTIALQEFLNPKARGDLTINKREIVKQLQGDIDEYLNACEDSDFPSKRQIALLRSLFDLTFKHEKWRCEADITPLGTFLSSLRSNGSSVNVAETENELHAILAKIMDYREQSLQQPA